MRRRPLFQDCFQTNRRRYMLVRPVHDKEVRFNAACASVEEGKILLPRIAAWLAEFKKELLGFPRSTKKDQADSFSQFINWSTSISFWRSIGREHPMSVERHNARMQCLEDSRSEGRRG